MLMMMMMTDFMIASAAYH